MGFSRYCPSSLDLNNFVVRSCRGGCASYLWPKPRPDFWKSGDLEIQKFGIQHNQKIRILKIKIRVAQNVGKVWISRKKSSWPHLGPSGAFFCVDRKNREKNKSHVLSVFDQVSCTFYPGSNPCRLFFCCPSCSQHELQLPP